MKAAYIIVNDENEGNTSLHVTYSGGYDKKSPSHNAIRRITEYIDTLGMEIQEPEQAEAEAPKLRVVP
tara:strand:+ start:820 stop:1023 length:204 start_codon:yes stop_codon:yes gene_type:complete